MVLAGIVLVIQYFTIASTLPSVADLQNKASQFETTRFYDSNGQVIYEMLDPNAGRRTYVPLSKISPEVVAATIATEDKDFYTHPGFDILAITRALIQNYTHGDVQKFIYSFTCFRAGAIGFAADDQRQRFAQVRLPARSSPA